MARLPRCIVCDRETDDRDNTGMCRDCVRELNTPIRLPDENIEPLNYPAPAIGVHVAGPVERDGDVSIQRCARCRDVLMVFHPFRTCRTLPPGRFYPDGAIVERGRGWQAMCLRPDALPTCLQQDANVLYNNPSTGAQPNG